ncbi:MAG: TerB family tellurite resistance protein [Flavobacteriales bacterium]|nr:TerB family tellurite resistance protein [Flavobacteriales bacterium]
MDNQHQEKLSLLQDLIALSKADNNVSFMETQFINSVALSLGVSADELQQLISNPIDYSPQDREIDRIIQFYRLLLLMGVDANHHDKEIDFCKNLGLKMGLNPIAINEVVKRILASEKGMLPPDELISIFQTHHN